MQGRRVGRPPKRERSGAEIFLFRKVIIMQKNVCSCLDLTLNPAEPSAQASLTLLSTVARLSLSIHYNLSSHPPHVPPR